MSDSNRFDHGWWLDVMRFCGSHRMELAEAKHISYWEPGSATAADA
jgi:hypothetical protein